MQIGDKVIVKTDNMDGDAGRIVRKDDSCNFWFIVLDKHKNDPFYRYIEFGPFADRELEAA